MDQFFVFLSFYGLLLGLAATEILASIGLFVRTRGNARIELQSAFLTALTFLMICAAWIDAWNLRTHFAMDFLSLLAPIGVATGYYIAAVVVLPRESAGLEDPARYFAERKHFVVGALIVSELFYKLLMLPVFLDLLNTAPMVFWLWSLPNNVAILAGLILIYFAKPRRANIAAMVLEMAILTLTYLPNNLISNAIRTAYGYPLI
ncbi:MAG: hypothetical protein ACT4OE_00580 [Sphingosinicella sp.]